MECNREEAIRAKMIAEKKLGQRDAMGAKKFALKAQNLYPQLDGLSQFLATLDVYVSSEERINGEINWYRVLGITPSADDDTIRGNYRKLALTLHPDKNKSVGAEGAFNLVSEAWGCLSHKALRGAFDRKLSTYHMYNNVQTSKDEKFNSVNLKRATHPMSVPSPHFSKADTFWTLCAFCKTHFEYLRFYLNSNLICQNCRQPFIGAEIPLAPMNGNGRTWPPYMPGQNSMQHVKPESKLSAFYKAEAAGKVSQGVSKPDMRKDSTERKAHGFKQPGTSAANNPLPRMPSRNIVCGDSGGQMGSFETGKRHHSGKLDQIRELSQLELRNMLIEKAKKDIQLTFNSCTSKIEKEKEKQNVFPNSTKGGRNFMDFADTKSTSQAESSLSKTVDELDKEGADPVSMDVPDPDFHDFDNDRTEGSFAPNQVWAAYDEDDGMPRYFAMIHCVISSKPLRMRISWLNSKNNRELSPINWIGSGFFKTNGVFQIGKYELCKSLNCFSHKVKWEKGARGTVQIYPSKGDVWAMYSNWSPNWNSLTPDELIHKYDMVEVLEDYNEERGVSVAPLVKVAGFKTVFRRHPDSSTTGTIPKEEIFRLSHQVPSYVLTGKEGPNVPIGCLELDPASMPLELVQAFTEVQVKEMVENAEKSKKSGVELMEDCETVTAAKKTEAEWEKLIVYKRKRGQN